MSASFIILRFDPTVPWSGCRLTRRDPRMTGVFSIASDDIRIVDVTSQEDLDSYSEVGVFVSVRLINALAIESAGGKPVAGRDPIGALQQVLAVDPPSVAQLGQSDVADFVALADSLHGIFAKVSGGDVDGAADCLNGLLRATPPIRTSPRSTAAGGSTTIRSMPLSLACGPRSAPRGWPE